MKILNYVFILSRREAMFKKKYKYTLELKYTEKETLNDKTVLVFRNVEFENKKRMLKHLIDCIDQLIPKPNDHVIVFSKYTGKKSDVESIRELLKDSDDPNVGLDMRY